MIREQLLTPAERHEFTQLVRAEQAAQADMIHHRSTFTHLVEVGGLWR